MTRVEEQLNKLFLAALTQAAPGPACPFTLTKVACTHLCKHAGRSCDFLTVAA